MNQGTLLPVELTSRCCELNQKDGEELKKNNKNKEEFRLAPRPNDFPKCLFSSFISTHLKVLIYTVDRIYRQMGDTVFCDIRAYISQTWSVGEIVSANLAEKILLEVLIIVVCLVAFSPTLSLRSCFPSASLITADEITWFACINNGQQITVR